MKRITSCAITKENTLKIGFVETLEDGTINEVQGFKCDRIAHQDLVDAFNALPVHLALICELREVHKLTLKKIALDPSVLEGITVSSFFLSGESENEGVTLTGRKTLIDGKQIQLTTPSYKWDDSDGYRNIEDLAALIDHLQNEILQYMDGKSAPSSQLKMFEQNMGLELPAGVTVSFSKSQ